MSATDPASQEPANDDDTKVRVYVNSNANMTLGKMAAHVAHTVLQAAGVHPGIPIVVLGAKPRDIENLATVIRDAGRTELEPGTLTAGTDWAPTSAAVSPSSEYLAARRRLDELIDVTSVGGTIRVRKDDLVAVLEHDEHSQGAANQRDVLAAALVELADEICLEPPDDGIPLPDDFVRGVDYGADAAMRWLRERAVQVRDEHPSNRNAKRLMGVPSNNADTSAMSRESFVAMAEFTAEHYEMMAPAVLAQTIKDLIARLGS